MRLIVLLFCLSPFLSIGQSADSLISVLKEIDLTIKKSECAEGQLLSNRGMNLFMADRVGYYLSDHENLTFCKNNLTFNTANGLFSMSHSLFEPTGADLPVRSYHVIGLKANALNAFHSATNQSAFNNELGFTYKHFWLSKPQITLHNCNEKWASDARRATILVALQKEIQEQSSDFEQSLANIQNLSDPLREELKSNFYKKIGEEYSRELAEREYRELFETMRFKKIAMHWTNFNVYIPVIRQRFTVADNFENNFNIRKSYPAELSISHTRFIETHNATKIYLNFRAGLFANNSINSKKLRETNLETYRSLGGKNISYLTDKQLNRFSIGNYENFITPNLKAQFVYFPPENHFGISATVEQNFGNFKALNGTIGIPVVLIDKQSAPLTNFEIQIHYFDMTNSLNSGRTLKDNVSIGISFGQPIGRNVY
ncbi:MAG: hypothetical protein V4683_00235 [Bacteroidota bacterium]